MAQLNDFVVRLAAWAESRKGEEGQGMAEYGLILALVAVVAAVALTALGPAIAGKINQVVTSLA